MSEYLFIEKSMPYKKLEHRVIGTAFAIEPVYDGEDGIRAKVFASNYLACHSSDKSGRARNGAPAGVNYGNYTDVLWQVETRQLEGGNTDEYATVFQPPPDA